MQLLLDTHIILWAISEDKRLTNEAIKLLNDTNNSIFFSPISIWEVELKHTINSNLMPIDGSFVYTALTNSGYIELPLSSKQVINLESFVNNNPNHKDPFDRLLFAQAKSANYYFVTHDLKFKNYYYDKLLLV